MSVLVVLSGGLDSACTALYYVQRGMDVKCVSFNYGQRHTIELTYAIKFCDYMNFPHMIIPVSADLFDDALTNREKEVPDGPYKGNEVATTYVAFRNGLMASMAASYAYTHNCEYIAMGIHKEGTCVPYPDCTPDFVNKMAQAIASGTRGKVWFEAPFVNMTKTELVQSIMPTQEIVDLTYSCYKGGETPCHKCATCIDRDNALKAIGLR